MHKFNQEVRLTSDAGNTLFGHGFDWQVGGFFTHESTTLTQPFQALDATDTASVLTPALGGAIIPGDYKETLSLPTSRITSTTHWTSNSADAART